MVPFRRFLTFQLCYHSPYSKAYTHTDEKCLEQHFLAELSQSLHTVLTVPHQLLCA
jgi:hypothetical protein